jgi:hypothetical protein
LTSSGFSERIRLIISSFPIMGKLVSMATLPSFESFELSVSISLK